MSNKTNSSVKEDRNAETVSNSRPCSVVSRVSITEDKTFDGQGGEGGGECVCCRSIVGWGESSGEVSSLNLRQQRNCKNFRNTRPVHATE